MGHKKMSTQKSGRKLSYRQSIFCCFGGLMGILVLIFFVYAYCDSREEYRESALREARNTADNVVIWTEEYFAMAGVADADQAMAGVEVSDQVISEWERGVRAFAGTKEGIVVLDSQGQALFSTDQGLDEFCQRVLDENAESPILSVGGGIFLATAVRASETQDWSCFVFHDVAEEKDIYRFPYGRFLLLVLLSGISFIVAAYLLYRPIDRLLKTVDGETKQKNPGENELEFLYGSFNALKDDSQKLRKMMLQKQDKLQEMFTLRLIRGDILLQEEYEEYVRDFNLAPWQYYVTVVAVLNLREEEETQSNIKEDAICLRIVEEMPERLKNLAWVPPVYNACAITAILGGNDEEQLFEQIEEYYTELQKFSEAVCGYPLLMGVSATHTKPSVICEAYRESVHALIRSGSSGQEEMRSGSNVDLAECHFYLIDTMASETPYDASHEKKVQQGIKNIDKALCYQATNEFFKYLAEENYDEDELVVYVLRFVNTILLTAMEVRVDMEALYPNGLRRLYDELMEVLEPSRERRYVKKNLIDPILEARSELMEKRSYSLLEDIEQLIRDKKGDISLAECAESLGVHTTYIWKVLKAERGKTFSDFLEEYKLEEAKRLLLNTDMTVAEIATTLNYTNAQNFIRFFSKSTGMTPGKFRKLY